MDLSPESGCILLLSYNGYRWVRRDGSRGTDALPAGTFLVDFAGPNATPNTGSVRTVPVHHVRAEEGTRKIAGNHLGRFRQDAST